MQHAAGHRVDSRFAHGHRESGLGHPAHSFPAVGDHRFTGSRFRKPNPGADLCPMSGIGVIPGVLAYEYFPPGAPPATASSHPDYGRTGRQPGCGGPDQ